MAGVSNVAPADRSIDGAAEAADPTTDARPVYLPEA